MHTAKYTGHCHFDIILSVPSIFKSQEQRRSGIILLCRNIQLINRKFCRDIGLIFILRLRLYTYEIVRIRAADFTVNGNWLRPTNRNRDLLLLFFRQHYDRGEMRSREGQDTILDLAVRVGRNRRAIAFQNAARELIAEPFFAHRNRDRGRIGIAAVFRCQLDIPSTGDLLAIQFRALIDRSHSDARQAGSRNTDLCGFIRLCLRLFPLLRLRQRRAEGSDGIRPSC